MASFQKLVFLSALLLSSIILGDAAPLKARQRRSTAGDSTSAAVALTLKAQQDSFTFDLSSSLVVPSSTLKTLDTVPASCAMYNSLQSECPTFFVASNVTYNDCGDSWTICRCSTANMTMDTVVDRLGRVPVGLRRYIATVLVVPDVTTHAYTLTSGDIHLFGDAAMDTWLHEVSHQ